MFRKFSIVLAAFILTSSARSDEASGQYFLEFDAPTSIWDISGDYEDTIGGLTLNYTILSDPKGRFEGLGSFTYEDENGNTFDGDCTFKGRIRSGHKVVRVSKHGKLSGAGTVSGEEDDFDAILKGSFRERLEIDPVTFQLIGKATTTFRIDAPGFVHTNGHVRMPDFDSEIPLGMDGSWDLTMNVFSDGSSNYTGNAAIDLSNGAQYGFILTGKHRRNDLSKFKLQGDEASPQARFTISATATNNEVDNVLLIQSLSGKLLGQRIRLKP